jgi:hypothetical protein
MLVYHIIVMSHKNWKTYEIEDLTLVGDQGGNEVKNGMETLGAVHIDGQFGRNFRL